MAERIHPHIACQFADECSFSVVNSLGNTDNNVRYLLHCFCRILDKPFRIKSSFRQIDQHRIVSFIFSRQCAGRRKPSGITSHNLYNCHRLLIVIDRCVKRDLAYCRSNIFCSASVSRCMIRHHKVIVNRLRDSHEPNVACHFFRISGELAHRIHRIISSDIEEISNPIFCKLLKQFRVHFIIQIFRQFISAGSKIRSRCCPDQFQLSGLLQRLHIHNLPVQEPFDTIHHSIYCSEYIFPVQSFIYHSVQACVNYCCRSAGLSDDHVFLHLLPPHSF